MEALSVAVGLEPEACNAWVRYHGHVTEQVNEELDSATRAQVAEFLQMTPAERLRSLVNTVEFIRRARLRMSSMEPGSSGR